MADFPQSFHLLTPSTISSIGQYAVGAVIGSLGNPTSNTWPASNRVIYMPFRVAQPITIIQFLTFNGAAVSGNLQVGVYDANGVLIVSSASTAHTGTNALQVVNVTDTRIGPGLFYMALTFDNTTSACMGFAPAALTTQMTRMLGLMEETPGSFGLPATATFSTVSQALIPFTAMSLGGFS
jgi:hypothetical protein